MILRAPYGDEWRSYDVSQGKVISIPLSFDELGPNCFYAPLPSARPVVAGDFVGDTRQGGAVNFKTITINPHGNGTHTECVGHISKEAVVINQVLTCSIHLCQVATVWPRRISGDRVITLECLPNIDPHCQAIALRTMPNDDDKLHRQYSGTHPPYFDPTVLRHLREVGVQHLLTDLPSVDPEQDGGALAAHKAWWDYPATLDRRRTITELIYLPSAIPDGIYLADLQIADLTLDASPSRVLLYAPLSV